MPCEARQLDTVIDLGQQQDVAAQREQEVTVLVGPAYVGQRTRGPVGEAPTQRGGFDKLHICDAKTLDLHIRTCVLWAQVRW